ncbi:NAD-dependent formate dehydrogenase delta subunit (plasmid) [Rhodovastum atsumiense]|uniref:formate dehydrogenase subunit delta n=1 Tax=Rhodovastum atsumiense TaxID=504468 RepID=UPI0020248917|nr:formate dehydrogenase subunit delta [Rhodovastum atsumiense]CAH2605581.1 NAD-dependent formate dehydrogenase delta subunit [Rhodovastum atsumiense]
MEPDKLVTMANQISRFFSGQKRMDAVQGTADHLQTFWDPRMRTAICAHLASGGAGLDPVARDAVARLAATGSEARPVL